MPLRLLFLSLLLQQLLFAFSSPAQTELHYSLILENPQAHLIRVELALPAQAGDMDFCMPVWAPGSYVIENFSRFVQEFSAHDESQRPLRFSKIDKQTWRVKPRPGSKQILITYRIFANALDGTRSEFNENHAQVFGPQVFMYPADGKEYSVRLSVRKPVGWRIATGMQTVNDSTFVAPNYDSFIDAPLEIGSFRESRFDTAEANFRLVVHGEDDSTRIDEFAHQLKKIVGEQICMMGGAPFTEYVFIWHVDPRANYYGLEHMNSASIGMPHRLGDLGSAGDNWSLYDGLQRQDIDLEYASHEFFHLWNVKRIRPLPLGPFDYTTEAYTTCLWIAEGFTDYFGYLSLVRCGLWSERKWLQLYSNIISAYRTATGWKYRSASENSFDTWLWSYGAEDQTNMHRTFHSYYPGGNLIALCMDLRIRHETKGRRRLDDVMRAMLQLFAAPKPGYTSESFWQLVHEVTGLEWNDFRQRYVDGTNELPLEKYLSLAGMEVDTLSDLDSSHLGIGVRDDGEHPAIASVEANSSAEKSGLERGDRLLAINGRAVTMSSWHDLLSRHPPGDRIEVLIARGDRIKGVETILGKQPAASFRVKIQEGETESESALRHGLWKSCSPN